MSREILRITVGGVECPNRNQKRVSAKDKPGAPSRLAMCRPETKTRASSCGKEFSGACLSESRLRAYGPPVAAENSLRPGR